MRRQALEGSRSPRRVHDRTHTVERALSRHGRKRRLPGRRHPRAHAHQPRAGNDAARTPNVDVLRARLAINRPKCRDPTDTLILPTTSNGRQRNGVQRHGWPASRHGPAPDRRATCRVAIHPISTIWATRARSRSRASCRRCVRGRAPQLPPRPGAAGRFASRPERPASRLPTHPSPVLSEISRNHGFRTRARPSLLIRFVQIIPSPI